MEENRKSKGIHSCRKQVHQTTTLGTKAMQRMENSPPPYGCRAGANTPSVPVSLNAHTHPRPRGWTCSLHQRSLLMAGGPRRGDPQGKQSPDQAPLCDLSCDPIHNPQSVQKDHTGGSWRPPSPPHSTADVPSGEAVGHRPGFCGPLPPNGSSAPTLPWRRRPGRSA